MLSALSLADADGVDVPLMDDTKRAVVDAHGLLGVGPLRDSRRVLPTAHGGIDETRWEDGRLMAFTFEASSTLSIEDAIAVFRAMTRPMLQTLDNAPALLKWTEGVSGLALQRMVKLASDLDPPLQGSAAMLTWAAQFFAEDPRAYSQTLKTATSTALSAASGGMTMPFTFPFTFSISGGGTVSITNDGNRPSPPVFRIYGYCVNPQIVLLGTGQRITLNGTVPANSYLEIDTAGQRSISMGLSNRADFLDSANTTWFELPGESTSDLQMVAGDFDSGAHLDVLLRDAHS